MFPRMSTLTEIEQAADILPPDQKRKLAWFLLTRLSCSRWIVKISWDYLGLHAIGCRY